MKYYSHYSFVSLWIAGMLLTCMLDAQTTAKNQLAVQHEIPFEETIYDWTRTFAQVLQLAQEKHYKVTNLEECMIKSIDSFLNNLDPHSNFLDQKTYKLILESTSGEFFGIGIIIDGTRSPKDDFLLVMDTIADGPADKIGLKPLDKIVEIDGSPLKNMTTDEATAKLKGEKGTKVSIKILRDGQADIITFEISRDVVKEQTSLAFAIEGQNVYYVSLNTFSAHAYKNLKEIIEEAQKKQYKGLILDLRNNSGGLLTSAIEVAGIFLNRGSLVVTTKTKGNRSVDEFRTNSDPLTTAGLPVFILINEGTASSAEILAGCLKAHSEELSKKAGHNHQQNLMVFLVGTPTFGKGSVQEVIPIDNNCAVKLTYALYFLPGDLSIQGHGIEPDFYVEKLFPPTEQIKWLKKHYGHEYALPNYIKNEQYPEKDGKDSEQEESDNQEKRWLARAKKTLEEDNQIRDTLTLLNMFDFARAHTPALVSTREKAINFINSIVTGGKKISMRPINLQ